MKVKIKSFNGQLPSYLTVGRVYSVFSFNGSSALIRTDEGDLIFTEIRGAYHLNGGSWEVVND